MEYNALAFSMDSPLLCLFNVRLMATYFEKIDLVERLVNIGFEYIQSLIRAIDVAIMRDNVELMMILRPHSNQGIDALIWKSVHDGAINCLRAILKSLRRSMSPLEVFINTSTQQLHDYTRKGDVENQDRVAADFRKGVHMLLSAMKEENPDRELLIPRHTIVCIWDAFYGMIGSKHEAMCLELLITVLHKGVNLYSVISPNWITQICCHGKIIGRTCYDVNYLQFPHILNRNLWEIEASRDSVIQFSTWMLACGSRPNQSCFHALQSALEMQNQNKDVLEFVHLVISLMSSGLINQFRKHIQKVNKPSSRKVKIDVSPVSSGFLKTLKQSCRYVILNSIRHRRIAEHANSLPLPAEIKNYLRLWCEF